jgi:hypothetical protein
MVAAAGRVNAGGDDLTAEGAEDIAEDAETRGEGEDRFFAALHSAQNDTVEREPFLVSFCALRSE